MSELKQRLDVSEVIDVRHEDVVSHPAAELSRWARFLDLDVSSDYVQGCATSCPHLPGGHVTALRGPDELLTWVQDGTDQFVLRGYSFR